MVAAPPHTGPRVVAEPGGDADRCVRGSLPPAWLLGDSGGVGRACVGLGAGVQPVLRPPLRVDLDQPADAAVVRQTRTLNLLHDFGPGPLAPPFQGGAARAARFRPAARLQSPPSSSSSFAADCRDSSVVW